MSRLAVLLLAALAAFAVPQGASAQASGKVLRIIVPFPPGGGVDVVARTLAQRLGPILAQPIIVENRPGASGNIGADAVAKSTPDGSMLLFSASTFIVNPMVAAQKAPFDPIRDFTHLALVAKGPVLFIVHPQAGSSLNDFVARAKAHPESYNLATGGFGSAGHLAAESFKLRAGLSIPVILYKGTAPAFADLMGGQISGLLDPLVTSLPLAKGGKVKALALAGPRRSPLAPEVPTFAEAGMPGFEFYTWYGLWGAAGMPEAAAERLEKAVTEAGTSPEMKSWLDSQGLEFGALTGKAFIDFSRGEQAAVEDIVRRGNLTRQ
jgi:tripartite-type tricarboxylate transporter receptor subunit TctC